MALSLAHSTLFSKPSFFLRRNGVRTFSYSIHSASSSLHYCTSALPTDKPRPEKWRQQVVAILEVGGVKISKDGMYPHQYRILLSQFHILFVIILIVAFDDI